MKRKSDVRKSNTNYLSKREFEKRSWNEKLDLLLYDKARRSHIVRYLSEELGRVGGWDLWLKIGFALTEAGRGKEPKKEGSSSIQLARKDLQWQWWVEDDRVYFDDPLVHRYAARLIRQKDNWLTSERIKFIRSSMPQPGGTIMMLTTLKDEGYVSRKQITYLRHCVKWAKNAEIFAPESLEDCLANVDEAGS